MKPEHIRLLALWLGGLVAVSGTAAILRTRRRRLKQRLPGRYVVKLAPGSPSSAKKPEQRMRVSSSDLVLVQKPEPRRKAMPAVDTKNLMATSYERRVLVVMVGLPARGKSYIVKMLCRYLRWSEIGAKVFNVGDYRRKLGLAGVDKNFFDAGNADAAKTREQMAAAVLDEAYDWLSAATDGDPRVAFFDATNTTRSRRAKLLERNRKERKAVLMLFVESICDDDEVLRRNYELKLENNDYKGMDPEVALRDFMERVRAYEAVYEAVEDTEDQGKIAYIKIYNVGQKLATRYCNGFLASNMAFYLQNIHTSPRQIWLSRHSESVDQASNRLGGDRGDLTEAGRQYTILLSKFLRQELEKDLGGEDGWEEGESSGVTVFCGTQAVHFATVERLQMSHNVVMTSLLNELRGGLFDGWMRDEIKTKRPDVWEARQLDKLNYRYPGSGESYIDVMHRIRPIIIELERQRRPVMVICHLAVMRCVYAYFMGIPTTEIPYLSLPTHTVLELSPGPFGCREKRYPLFELDDLM